MKLLVIINSLGKGGAETMLVASLPEFRNRGLEVEVLQLSRVHSVAAHEDALVKAGIPVHSLEVSSVYTLTIIPKLKRFVSGRGYQLIHVHLFPAQYWAAAAFRRLNIPLIFTEHNIFNRRFGKFYFYPSDVYTYKKYARIIAITEDVKDALKKWAPMIESRIVVINNGLNLASFRAKPATNKRDLKAALNISADAKLLLMAARFDWPKTHNILVEAMLNLGPQVHLLLAGDGPKKAAAIKLVHELGISNRVHFLGFREDIAGLMKMADVNVLSSDFEGLSTVTMEAMAAGKPFLGSDVSGINNVVPDARFLFEAGNVRQLAEHINAILNDDQLAANMTAAGVEHVKKYDLSFMVENHLRLYEQLVAP